MMPIHLSLLVCLLFLFFSPEHSAARLVDKTLVLVNAEVILQSDLDKFSKNFPLRRELDPFVSLTGVSPSSQKEILEYLVQERLVLQKIQASDEEVEEEINSVQKNNKINRDQLKEVLKSQGVNFEDYRILMMVSVAKRKMVDRELRPLAAISDEDVKNHYYTDPAFRDRKKEQKLVLTYSFKQMILPNISVAEEATRRIKAGEDFDAVVSDLNSKGAESTQISSLTEDNLNPKIRDAIQGLRVGEATKPIATGANYLVLKITEVGAPKDPVFERDKEKIRPVLFQKSLVNQLKIWTEREKAASYVHFSSN